MKQPPRVDSPEMWDIAYFPLGAAAFGGAERSLLELASAQQTKGLRVLVCYERALDNGDFMSQARARGLSCQRVDWSPEDGFIQVASAAWNFFRRINARLLHFNISWRRHMWLIPLMARLLSSARLIGTMRAIPDSYDLIPRRRYLGFIPGLRLWTLPDHAIGRIWAMTLHLTVSVNRNDFPPRLIREFGFSPQTLKVVYNGVAIPDSIPSVEERQARKASLVPNPEVFLATYVGRVSDEKGIHYAVKALAFCDPNVHLVIAGEGEQLEALKTLSSQLGLASRVHFIGYVSDPFSVFSAADVALVPSLWNEAFGRVVVEAMACATPVIATSVGGMRELFTDGEEGLFIPPADAKALAAAIDRLFNGTELWEKVSHAGRKLAESRYATTRVADDYSELYAALRYDMPVVATVKKLTL